MFKQRRFHLSTVVDSFCKGQTGRLDLQRMHCISSVLRRQCHLSSETPNLSHDPSLPPWDVLQPPCSSLIHNPPEHCSGCTSFGWDLSLAASSPPRFHLGNQQHTQGRAINSGTRVRTAHTPQASLARRIVQSEGSGRSSSLTLLLLLTGKLRPLISLH